MNGIVSGIAAQLSYTRLLQVPCRIGAIRMSPLVIECIGAV
jgi:hypothetical protein